jgi:hypothetical protein
MCGEKPREAVSSILGQQFLLFDAPTVETTADESKHTIALHAIRADTITQ